MISRLANLKIRQRTVLAITIAAVAVLVTISTASATLLTINTNDLTLLDWGNQPIFHTDPPGDLNPDCAGGDGRDDIIETYVASGPTGTSPTIIYFLVKLAEPNPGLGTLQYHKISAYLDCDPQGMDDADANVIYSGFPDQVVLGNGALPNPSSLYGYTLPGPEGQRVTNDTTNFAYEWQGGFIEMSKFTTPSPLNCKPSNVARIKFTTVSVDTSGELLCMYDDTGWREFDTPTTIEIVTISAANKNDSLLLAISIIAIVLAIIIFSVGFSWSRKLNI